MIQVTSANLTFQKLQFIELNPSRATNSPLFTTSSSSNLTFHSVLIKGVRTIAKYYFFCKATDSFVNISNSEFRNLSDFTSSLIRSPIVVCGSRFNDITTKSAAFISLTYYTGPKSGFAFKNNSFENITVGQTAVGAGFIYSLSTHINTTIEDFYINNVTFNTETSFFAFYASKSQYFDTQNNQTAIIIKNGVLQNMFEKPKTTLLSSSGTSNSLFVYSSGPTVMIVRNLSATNCIFTNLSMITFNSVTNDFLNVWKVLPFLELTDITIKSSRNANFIIFLVDTVNISNVYLEELSIKDVTITNSLFKFSGGHLMNANNITANNVSGPLFQLFTVLAHNFSNLSFNNISTSQRLSELLQRTFYITKGTDFGQSGLDPSRSRDSFFDQINLNGYTLIDGIDSSLSLKDANNSLFIGVHAPIGKFYLTNSVWHNNLLTGLYSTSLFSFEVDNVTIDHDPEFSSKQVLTHKGFSITIAQEIVLKNSVFQNNQNYIVFEYSNTLRTTATDQISSKVYLTLENVTVRNNSAVLDNIDSQYSSLFIIYSPIKLITVSFRNSIFENNKILNGLINSLENYQANLELTNNTFDNNYATQAAAVFSSSNMRQTTSALTITNNTFTNNRCDQNGGVFSFILTDYDVLSVNNTYINNTAGLAGGVGYAFRASFVFLEEQGVYLNNSAGSFGGVWHVSLNTYQANLQSFEFSQTSFVNSRAKQKGGAIYLDNGGMITSNCTFRSSQAVLAGGDFYISIGKSINIIDTNFIGSLAPQGSFVYAEDIYGSLNISRVQVTDIFSKGPILTSSSGSLGIKDSVFENINSSLLLLSSVTTSINNTIFNNISCSKSFCLLKAISSKAVEVANSPFTNVRSNVDLIALSDCTQASLYNLTVQDMLKVNKEYLYQIFFLNTLNVQSLDISQSNFSKIGFSGIKAKSTNIRIQDSIFSNRLKDGRLLSRQLILENDLSSAKLSQPIQFIILDSSNSTITGTSFIENSFNTLVNGGAVQILGSTGIHIFTDCTFENNQAFNGGALFVKGQANSISLINSQFDNNQATKNGGALNFADHSVKNVLEISQATFHQNNATLGGAVYLGTQALVMDSSSFIENNAFRGGAIATMSTANNPLVNLRESSFISNRASEGAALIALQEMNFDYSTSSFAGNTATTGGDVASTPTSLRLRIYRFESYFLLINETSVKDILSNKATVLIYDSVTADASDSVAFTSGSQPNLLFEVTILDAFGRKMDQTNNAQGEFKISSSSSSSSNLIGLLGTTTFTYTSSIAYIFKAFSVKGPFETAVILSIEGTYVSQTSSSTKSLPSLKFPIVLSKCSIGQTYEKSTAICSSCSSDTFSLADPFKTQTCQKCLDNAVCLGGSFMYPAQGYWRSDESSENFIKCPQTDSCLGGSKDDGKNISLTGFCGGGYEGIACSSCTSGYAKFGSSQSCANCKESKIYYVMFGGYLLIQAAAIIFSVKMNLAKESSSANKKSVVQSTLIKIVIDFVQILTLISEFNFNFPPVVDALYNSVSKILPTNTDALSVDCFIALKKGNNEHVFFYKILVILAEPFAYMILAYLVWIIIFRIKKHSIFRNPDFKYNMLLTIIVIIYVLQPGVIKLMFELFNCKNYGSSGNPKYYLVYDVNVECWKHEHLVWGLSIAIPTIITGLLIPFGILAFWTRDKSLTAEVRVQKAYTFIFKPYKNKALFWELAILTRKATLILISVFITSQYLQAYLGFFLLALYYASLYKISPYNTPQLNFAEAISVGSSAFIFYSGLYFVQVNGMDTISYILFALDIICGIVFVIFVIYTFVKKNAATIQKNITRIGSKILTWSRTTINSQQNLRSPGSLQFNLHSDSPMSTDRMTVSTERFASIEKFMSAEKLRSTEKFTSTENLMTTERFMSTEGFMPTERFMTTDRFFSPVFRIRESDEEMSASRIENNHEELAVFSPANQTQAGLFIFSSSPRESSLPADVHELKLGAEDPVQEFAETLNHETRNNPRRSGKNKIDRVFKFTKEDWINELSKKTPEKESERKHRKSF